VGIRRSSGFSDDIGPCRLSVRHRPIVGLPRQDCAVDLTEVSDARVPARSGARHEHAIEIAAERRQPEQRHGCDNAHESDQQSIDCRWSDVAHSGCGNTASLETFRETSGLQKKQVADRTLVLIRFFRLGLTALPATSTFVHFGSLSTDAARHSGWRGSILSKVGMVRIPKDDVSLGESLECFEPVSELIERLIESLQDIVSAGRQHAAKSKADNRSEAQEVKREQEKEYCDRSQDAVTNCFRCAHGNRVESDGDREQRRVQSGESRPGILERVVFNGACRFLAVSGQGVNAARRTHRFLADVKRCACDLAPHWNRVRRVRVF
jgi:hypothetical protein